jgi:hypothetical protein
VSIGNEMTTQEFNPAIEQFNACAGEIRKLQADVAKLATNELLDYAHRANGHDFSKLNDRLTAIEAQLTALRADADKGRERLDAAGLRTNALAQEVIEDLEALSGVVAKGTVTHKRNLHLRPVSRKKRKR